MEKDELNKIITKNGNHRLIWSHIFIQNFFSHFNETHDSYRVY